MNAAISTTLLLTNYDIDFLINVGSAGGLSLSQNVGDVVISTGVLHHDVDVTAFQRELGEVPGMPRIFEPDKKALKLVENILKIFICRIIWGLLFQEINLFVVMIRLVRLKEFS